jgi:hypothetical protein
MRSSIRKLALVAASAAFLIAAGTSAQAQTSASAPAVATAATSDAKPLTKAEQRKQRRAQHKAARKAARSKNNAELKKLENAGYRPNAPDPNYPQNVQDAQRKAAAATGASQ